MKTIQNLMAGSLAAIISCPDLNCAPFPINAPITHDLCYQYDQKQPNAKVSFFDCNWYQIFG